MSPSQLLVSGKIFHAFAFENQDVLIALSGTKIHHINYGFGVIDRIETRENYLPLIYARFESETELKIFNLSVFDGDLIETVELNQSQFHGFELWRKSYEVKQAQIAEEKKRQAILSESQAQFLKIAGKFQLERLASQSDMLTANTIAIKLEEKKVLTNEEIDLLIQYDCFYALARYYYRLYTEDSKNIWDAIKACKYLRKLEKPNNVVEITANILSNEIKSAKILSALYTVRGAAMCDMSNIDEALVCGNKAVDYFHGDPHPHNLLGKIWYLNGDPSKGDEHFALAERFGGSIGQTTNTIKAAITKSAPKTQRILAAYLLNKDPKKYSWVKQLVSIT